MAPSTLPSSLEMRVASFEEHYSMTFTGAFSRGKKHPVGQKDPRWCRFCRRDAAQTTFRSEAHAIPQLLGNRQLVSYEECDACNKYVAEELEPHLNAYIRPMRTLGQIPGRSGVPSMKSRDKSSRIDVDPVRGFHFRVHAGSDFLRIDEQSKKAVVQVDLEPHVPTAVFKMLVKIALSVMPRESLAPFAHTIQWVMQSDHTRTFMRPLLAYEAMVPGPMPTPGVWLGVLTRKADTPVPHCQMVIAFSNLIFQVPVPSMIDAQKREMKASFVPFPTPFEENWPYGPVKWQQVDFTPGEVRRGVRRHYSMGYQAMGAPLGPGQEV